MAVTGPAAAQAGTPASSSPPAKSPPAPTSPAKDQGPWALCPPPAEVWRPKPTPPADSTDQLIHVYADRVDITDKNKTSFSGNVIARQGLRQLEADRATYWRSDDRFEAIGDVRYFNDSFVVTADGARQ